jgi:DNA-binding transcriptional ArsR family regulator
MDTFELETLILKAIAHPVRLRILNALREDEECVCHLTALLRQRQAYVSQQLMFLRQAELIEDRKDGWRVYYRIKNPQIVDILEALNVFVGAKRTLSEAKTVPACPCPKCERYRQAEGGKRCKSKSSVRVALTA